jgi:hypothetical protein
MPLVQKGIALCMLREYDICRIEVILLIGVKILVDEGGAWFTTGGEFTSPIV